MKFRYRNKISFTHIFVNLVVITGFFYLIINADKYRTYSVLKIVQAYSDNSGVLKEVDDSSSINVNNIYLNDNLDGVITYIVQPGDTLSKIAIDFGVTASHIKKINNLRSDTIKPGQKLKITDDDGILYESKGETAKQIANKFKVKVSDLLVANSIDSVDYEFGKGDEVFIPISEEQYKKIFKKEIHKKRPVIKKVTRTISRTSYSYKGKNVVAKYRYRPNITNGFYRGHCTRYVAIKKFPYITKNKQRKLWNGNAKYWYTNAKKAGYKVGQTPKIGAIVVIRVGGRHYYYAGHVGIVRAIDWKKRRILIEEMNAFGKFVVSKRWIPMNSKIIGYIYL